MVIIMQIPLHYVIPDWFLNRQKDVKDGKYSQVLANGLDNKVCKDLELLRKFRPTEGCATSGVFVSRPAHQDHRPLGSNCECVQEAINL